MDTAAGKYILLVDDDVRLIELIDNYLRDNGYQTKTAHDGETAIELVKQETPMLVVLDVMLPGADGLAVCRSIRRRYAGPIIMMSALSDDIDEVAGLELGADDYLAKPVRPRVLLARVRAVLRRYERVTQQVISGMFPATVLMVGPLRICRGTMEVHRDNELIPMTSSEFELLWLLAAKRGRPVSRENLHNAVVHTPFDGLDRAIDLRISRLRRKIGDDPKCPTLIKTVRGQGYLLADPS